MNRTSAILCLRHCHSTGQAEDAPLTEQGQADAQRLALALQTWAPNFVISSPFLRAQQTLLPFVRAHNLPISLDDRLREHQLCEPGYPAWREALAQSFVQPDRRFPGGETSREARSRALEALGEIAAKSNRAVVATHGKLLSLLIGVVRPDFGRAEWQQLRNPDSFLFTFDAGRPVAVRQLDPFSLT